MVASLIARAALLLIATPAAAQLIDLDEINALPDPTYTIIPGLRSQVISYTESAVLASITSQVYADPLPTATATATSLPDLDTREFFSHLKPRSPCGAQPTTPNIYNATLSTPDGFVNDTNLAAVALGAVTPPGYNQSFANLQASSSANGYMGYQMLSAYDPQACAKRCNATNGCSAFNIYFERDPTVEPAQSCSNPSAFANIICTLWGGPVTASNAMNTGQWRDDFQVVMAGSNGYILTATPSVEGYLPADPLQSEAINAPSDCNGQGTYMGYQLFNDNTPFDVSMCAAACAATNSYNTEHPPSSGDPQLCKFWNTYILAKNGVSQGQYCAMYSQYWDPSIYATNNGQYDSDGNHFTIQYSYTFYNTSDIVTPVCPSDVSALQSDSGAQAFCTSYISYVAPTSTATTSTVVTTTATITNGCPANPSANRRRDLGKPQITAAAAPLVKRAFTTPTILSGRSPYTISSVCSRLATGTVTVTSTSTGTASVTTTVSTGATATPTGFTGLGWMQYNNNYNFGSGSSGFQASAWNSAQFITFGTGGDVNDVNSPNWPSGGDSCHLPGHAQPSADCSQFTVVWQGYYYAAQTGTHTFTTGTNVDNYFGVWSGSVAYSNFTNSNADYQATRFGGGPYTGGSITYHLSAGTYLPVTFIWANGGGPGAAFFSITTPDGVVHTNTTQYFLQPLACNYGNGNGQSVFSPSKYTEGEID